MGDKSFMKHLANRSDWATAQKFMCYEKTARNITEYIYYNFDGERIIDDNIIRSRIEEVRPLIDVLFDQVTFLPQYNMACDSTLVKLGLKTGHLVTENSIDNWYEFPNGNPTEVYLYYTAPEGLVYQIPDYLKEKRKLILGSLGKKESNENSYPYESYSTCEDKVLKIGTVAKTFDGCFLEK